MFVHFAAHTRKMTEKRNQNGKQYVYTEEMIAFDWCELQLFYKLQNNALTPSVFACIIDVH